MVAAASLAKEGGYALIYRKVLDHPAFRTPAEAMAFAYLVLLAQWKPARVRYRKADLLLERGQLAISVRDFAEAMERHRCWIERFMDRLRDRDIIETVTKNGVTVITICNYDKFQVSALEAETPAETLPETQNKEEKETPSKDNNKLLSKGSPKRATPWPADKGTIPNDWEEWAMSSLGWSRTQAVAEGMRFIDSALAKRRTYVDWLAAWRQWCRSPFQKTVASQQERLTL